MTPPSLTTAVTAAAARITRQLSSISSGKTTSPHGITNGGFIANNDDDGNDTDLQPLLPLNMTDEDGGNDTDILTTDSADIDCGATTNGGLAVRGSNGFGSTGYT